MSLDLFNPLLPEFRDDPHPYLHRLRQEDPVHYSPIIGVWMLTRYDHVLSVLRDHRFSASARHWRDYDKFFLRGSSPDSPLAQLYSGWMLQIDPPDHARLRTLVNKAFTTRAVELMRPSVQRVTQRLLDQIGTSRRWDAVAELSYPLPMLVIADLLGVPAEDEGKIKQWSMELLPSLTPAMSADALRRVNHNIVAFRDYFRELADQRRREPRPDLLTALLAAHEQEDRLSESELLSTCILFAFAGHASTVQGLASAIRLLIGRPDIKKRLLADRSLIPAAVEECLRYESPLHIIYRTTRETMTIGNRTIPPGEMLFLIPPAANRDPDRFADPDRFDIDRPDNRHLAFGYGIHFCLGAPLARLEMQIAVEMLLDRMPDLYVPPQKLEREPSLLLRGLKRLIVQRD